MPPAAGLLALAVLLVIVDLLFYREPGVEPDIGDRASASATLDDGPFEYDRAKLASLKARTKASAWRRTP